MFHLPPQRDCNARQCIWRHLASLSPVLRHDASSAVGSVGLTEQNTQSTGRSAGAPLAQVGFLESRRGKVTASGSLPTVLWVPCRTTSCTGWGGASATSTRRSPAPLIPLLGWTLWPSSCWIPNPVQDQKTCLCDTFLHRSVCILLDNEQRREISSLSSPPF